MNERHNWIEQGEEIVLLRKTMKVKAGYIAECLKMDRGNYSKMEYGYLNNIRALSMIRSIYKSWVANEVLIMNERIEQLKQLIK
jgi:hypothetical protein